MKFVSPEPVKDGAQDTIPNTFFWPAISLSKFREDMRTDGTVTPERLRQALLTAMAEVNADLYDFREKQQNRGCADLNSVPAEIIDGESQRVLLYRRAVFCWAKSNLVERYRDYDATGEGKKRRMSMPRRQTN